MFDMFKKKKDIMLDVFHKLGYDETLVEKEGFTSKAFLENIYLDRAIGEYAYELMCKEDDITADPTISPADAETYRKYFSELRLLLSGLVNTLDAKVFALEELGDHKE